MKRVLCVLLAVLMVCSLFLFSCAKEDEKKTTAGGAGENLNTTAEDKSMIYDAEVKKLNRTFTFLVQDNGTTHLNTNEIYAEALNGDKINDAVFARNSKLETDYGATIMEVRAKNPHTDNKESLIAGEYVGDFFFMSVQSSRTLGAANLLVDLYTLSQADWTKAWWNQNAMKALTINGKCFYTTGDGATRDDRATWVMLFNKDVISNAGLELPYKLVDEGKWTIDEMYRIMQATAVPGDDGVFQYNVEGDIIGYGGERFNNWAHVAAGNITISEISSDGVINIPSQPKQEMLDAWAKLKTLLTSPMRTMSGASTGFKKGWVTFSGLNVAVITNWQEAEVNYGLLPFPKVWESQDGYYTAPSQSQFGMFTIPQTVAQDLSKDWEKNGFISAAEQCAYFLEAFSYCSMNIITPAFYDQVLSKQAVKDAESAKYLDLALDTDHIILDPVALFDFGDIGYQLFYDMSPSSGMANDLSYDNFVSTYTSRVDAARTALQDYITITEAN